MPMMQDQSEEEEVAALRRLLKSGPRTNRARPVDAFVEPPAEAPPVNDAVEKGSKLAMLLQSQDGINEAEPMMRQELAQREAKYGYGSEHTLVSATCLAMLLQAKLVRDAETGEASPEEALRLYTRVVEGYESLETYGPAHTDTLNAVNNLAVFLKSLGRFDKALPLYERVLAGDEKALGPDHPHTLDSVFNLARLYDATGETAKAIPLYQRELAGCAKHYGQTHTETKTSAFNLANYLERVGETSQAEALVKEYALQVEAAEAAAAAAAK